AQHPRDKSSHWPRVQPGLEQNWVLDLDEGGQGRLDLPLSVESNILYLPECAVRLANIRMESLVRGPSPASRYDHNLLGRTQQPVCFEHLLEFPQQELVALRDHFVLIALQEIVDGLVEINERRPH